MTAALVLPTAASGFLLNRFSAKVWLVLIISTSPASLVNVAFCLGVTSLGRFFNASPVWTVIVWTLSVDSFVKDALPLSVTSSSTRSNVDSATGRTLVKCWVNSVEDTAALADSALRSVKSTLTSSLKGWILVWKTLGTSGARVALAVVAVSWLWNSIPSRRCCWDKPWTDSWASWDQLATSVCSCTSGLSARCSAVAWTVVSASLCLCSACETVTSWRSSCSSKTSDSSGLASICRKCFLC